MILYNVTINIDPEVHDEWLGWMKQVHIPDVLQTGLFTEGRIMRVLSAASDEGHTYSVQYLLESMDHFREYEQKYAAALRQAHTERYRDKFVAFRTLLESA
jgi:hypothetical protein